MLEKVKLLSSEVDFNILIGVKYSLQPLEFEVDKELTEIQYGTRGGVSGRKWYVCSICGLEFPEDEVVKRSGKIFCEDDFEDFIADKVKRR